MELFPYGPWEPKGTARPCGSPGQRPGQRPAWRPPASAWAEDASSVWFRSFSGPVVSAKTVWRGVDRAPGRAALRAGRTRGGLGGGGCREPQRPRAARASSGSLGGAGHISSRDLRQVTVPSSRPRAQQGAGVAVRAPRPVTSRSPGVSRTPVPRSPSREGPGAHGSVHRAVPVSHWLRLRSHGPRVATGMGFWNWLHVPGSRTCPFFKISSPS